MAAKTHPEGEAGMKIDMPKNAFKAALQAKRKQIGIWNGIPNGLVVEMLAGCGYDWVLIDTEHAPVTTADVLPMLQAAAPYPVSPIVRPGWNDLAEMKRLLDIGAQTLLVPYVQNADEAAAAVAAVRYPPVGLRGVAGATRASRFGWIPDYAKNAAAETCLLVQVETADALTQIEAIAAVDGVDGIFIGPADLAASMGYPGAPGHPEVRAAVMDGIRRITAAGKPAGFLALDQDYLREAEAAGALFIAVGVDLILLRDAAVSLRREWKG